MSRKPYIVPQAKPRIDDSTLSKINLKKVSLEKPYGYPNNEDGSEIYDEDYLEVTDNHQRQMQNSASTSGIRFENIGGGGGSHIEKNSNDNNIKAPTPVGQIKPFQRNFLLHNQYKFHGITSLPRYIESYESENQLKKMRKDLKTSDTFCALVSSFGFIMAFTENDIYYENGNIEDALCTCFRTICAITCLVLVFLIYKHYKIELEMMKVKNIINDDSGFYEAGLLWRFLMEVTISLIHTPPKVNDVFQISQINKVFTWSLDDFMTFFTLSRLYLCVRLFDHYTFWTGDRAQRVCKVNGFKASSSFAIKAYLKYKSLIILTSAICISIFILGAAVRIFERSFYNDSKRHNFNYVANAFWCIIVTMTTIGYGDIFPESHLGRLVIIFASIWGIFLLSLFVVTLNNNIQLSSDEDKVYNDLIKKEDEVDKLKKDSIELLQTYFRLKILKFQNKPISARYAQRMEVMAILKRFKTKRRGIDPIQKTPSDIITEIYQNEESSAANLFVSLTPIDSIHKNVKEIKTKQENIETTSKRALELAQKLYNLAYMKRYEGGIGITDSIDRIKIKRNYNGEEILHEYDMLSSNISSRKQSSTISPRININNHYNNSYKTNQMTFIAKNNPNALNSAQGDPNQIDSLQKQRNRPNLKIYPKYAMNF